MTDATAAVSPLRRRMIDDMSLRNLSPATQRSYIHAVKRFSRYCGRSPDQLGLEDVRAFQVYLVSQGISWASLNQTVCALRFFYGVTLDRAEIPERIVYARTPRKLPDILSADEVVRFLEAVSSLKARAALTTAYAAGLRASEAVSLKVADIDSDRMLIQVHHGKPFIWSGHCATNPIGCARVSGLVQSGFNEVAHSARPTVSAARPHTTLQISNISRNVSTKVRLPGREIRLAQ